jgi:hypothetical protein
MACKPYIFGTQPNNLTPQLTSVQGQNNWFTVPNGWFTKSAFAYDGKSPASEVVASPNSDFSWPVYYCALDDSGQQYAFQDIGAQTQLTYRPWRP